MQRAQDGEGQGHRLCLLELKSKEDCHGNSLVLTVFSVLKQEIYAKKKKVQEKLQERATNCPRKKKFCRCYLRPVPETVQRQMEATAHLEEGLHVRKAEGLCGSQAQAARGPGAEDEACKGAGMSTQVWT